MDLHGIDLNLLVAFEALMAERSVTRAGARIGRTQPAMSGALARLRSLLNDELFVRAPNGLQPTARALDLSEPISRALSEIQRTLEFTQLFDPATSTISISLGLSDHPAFAFLPRLVALLREKAPGMPLSVRNIVDRNDAVVMLDANEVDVTIGVPPVASARIINANLFQERFVCIVRKGHPIADRPLDIQTFLEQSHLLVSPENDRFGIVDAALARMGLKRRLGLTLPHMYAAPALVASSDMISTVLEGVVEASGQADKLCVMSPPIELKPAQFTLSWHRRNDTHPAQRWLREMILAAGPI
ncbi:LysR family transcriptional regulator [Brucella anthropi]|uniref:LysR family transcriptional regulator n=1 Tax=Brucella anthropi TaxID=529 RepID=A0A6I0DH18_BRUAN|nr:LysR family transcriptional regulator [Brucella anthropi]KAB2790334.1 LysR family transcriptional regulator [Brucella anthropi]